MDVNLVGDARLTLRALAPRLLQKEHGSWRASIETGVREWWKLMEERSQIPAKPINPQRLFWELSPRLPDTAMVVADSGSSANWFARDLKMRPGMIATVSGGLATMGCGVPYAIAAKFAHSDRVAIACVGDGAMQRNGMAELLTIKRYWKEWKDATRGSSSSSSTTAISTRSPGRCARWRATRATRPRRTSRT